MWIVSGLGNGKKIYHEGVKNLTTEDTEKRNQKRALLILYSYDKIPTTLLAN
jgi:hypothetical protein